MIFLYGISLCCKSMALNASPAFYRKVPSIEFVCSMSVEVRVATVPIMKAVLSPVNTARIIFVPS